MRIDIGTASNIGGRKTNADGVAVAQHKLGVGAAVVDGIGGSDLVCAASPVAANTAAWTAAGSGAQAGIMAATQIMPEGSGANAVAAVASVSADGRVEVAHVGDSAAWTWSPGTGLRRWGLAQNIGQHIRWALEGDHLTDQDREKLNATRIPAAMEVLDNGVLSGLAFASIPTISWSILRGEHQQPSLLILTSDGVHDAIRDDELMASLLADHAEAPAQRVADELVQAGISAPSTDPDQTADNATAAVIRIDWEA